jgi:uncharacterized membrane protein
MTILVLELKIPSGIKFSDLLQLKHVFFIYFLSFFILAIYWINHHVLLHEVNIITSSTLWSNVFFLLFLSLIPWSTSYVAEFPYAKLPQILYGIIMFFIDISWLLLTYFLGKTNSKLTLPFKFLDFRIMFTNSLIVIGIISGFFIPYITLICCGISLIPWIKNSDKLFKAIKKFENKSPEEIKEFIYSRRSLNKRGKIKKNKTNN